MKFVGIIVLSLLCSQAEAANTVSTTGNLAIDVRVTPTLSETFSPPNPSCYDNVPVGTQVATVSATWSNGATFNGTFAFGPPYNDDGGNFALQGNTIVTAKSLVGQIAIHNVSIVATDNLH